MTFPIAGLGFIFSFLLMITTIAATKLNTDLPLDGNVVTFLISPDSKHVVYLADQEIDGITELYSVPITGGTPTKLNFKLEKGGVNFSFLINSQSSHVVYQVTSQERSGYDLYSVPITGGNFY